MKLMINTAIMLIRNLDRSKGLLSTSLFEYTLFILFFQGEIYSLSSKITFYIILKYHCWLSHLTYDMSKTTPNTSYYNNWIMKLTIVFFFMFHFKYFCFLYYIWNVNIQLYDTTKLNIFNYCTSHHIWLIFCVMTWM